MDINLDFDFDDEITQESYDASNSGFKDLFDEKFCSFNPEQIISGGNNKIRSAQFDLDIEDSDLAIGYKRNEPPLSPQRPGRFF